LVRKQPLFFVNYLFLMTIDLVFSGDGSEIVVGTSFGDTSMILVYSVDYNAQDNLVPIPGKLTLTSSSRSSINKFLDSSVSQTLQSMFAFGEYLLTVASTKSRDNASTANIHVWSVKDILKEDDAENSSLAYPVQELILDFSRSSNVLLDKPPSFRLTSSVKDSRFIALSCS